MYITIVTLYRSHYSDILQRFSSRPLLIAAHCHLYSESYIIANIIFIVVAITWQTTALNFHLQKVQFDSFIAMVFLC